MRLSDYAESFRLKEDAATVMGCDLDPLVFIRDTARNLGISLNLRYWRNEGAAYQRVPFFTTHFGAERIQEPFDFFREERLTRQKFQPGKYFYSSKRIDSSNLMVPDFPVWTFKASSSYLVIDFSFSSSGDLNYSRRVLKQKEDEIPMGAVRYFIGDGLAPAFRTGLSYWKTNEPNPGLALDLNEFRLEKDDLGAFGPYSRNINLTIAWHAGESERTLNGIDLENLCAVAFIAQPREGHFAKRRTLKGNLVRDDVIPREIIESADYRPFVHRILEAYGKVPRENWHDPQIYLGVNDKKLEQLKGLLGMFFPTDSTVFEAAMARLESTPWESVPKLNLGILSFPAQRPRQIYEAGNLLASALESLGVMNREDAKRAVAQKILNGIMHGGFQQSPAHARTVLEDFFGK